jgi:hypothetical protein
MRTVLLFAAIFLAGVLVGAAVVTLNVIAHP